MPITPAASTPASTSGVPTPTPTPENNREITSPAAPADVLEATSTSTSPSTPATNATALPTETNTALSAGLRAPDGMIVASDINKVRAPTPKTRAERVKAGKRAEVPQRIQQGPTCGLYAFGMVMDYWHAKDAQNPTALVSDKDIGGKGRHYNTEPTNDERVLDYVRDAGYTSAGEMFEAHDLAETAAHFGYKASLYEDATLKDLYRVLDAGRPALVAFDVDYWGNPGDFGGKRAHYAVIEGYFDEDGERYLIARHGWGGRSDYVWKAADFDESWKALKSTDWYGTPGDGIIPSDASLKEPSKLDLPDLGDGQAGIARSLATKIIEIIPEGKKPLGGKVIEAL